MPVKKRKKKKVNKKIDRPTKKDIKVAAEQIPQMLAKEMNIQTPDPDTSTQKDIKAQYHSPEYIWKERMMWAGVILLASIVLFMWFMNANATFFDIKKNFKKTQEVQILNSNKEKITEILQSSQIKEQINQLNNGLNQSNTALTNTQLETLIQNINNLTNSTTLITNPGSNTSSTIQ